MPDRLDHLHVRSGFSYGLGTATPEEMVEGAARMGYGSLALTDRDGLYGIPRFLAACKERDLSSGAIVGAEITVYLRKSNVSGGVILLAESQQGYRSLCKLIIAYRLPAEGSIWPSAAARRNPLCDLGTLLSHTEGLICLSGALPFGLIPKLALSENTDPRGKSREVLSLLRDAFGRENVFVELSNDGTRGSRRRMGEVEALAERCSVPTVAAHEVTYLYPDDHRISEALSAVWNLTKLPPPEYRPTDRLYMRSPARMRSLFSDRPEAVRNAVEIAERCGGVVSLGGEALMPVANLPAGTSVARELMRLSLRGARELYPASWRSTEESVFPSRSEIKARLRREISCIETLNFTSYFLIAREAAEIARSCGTPVTGRGSAANSLVARCLGLTRPDPFEHRLLFERFLHEGRSDPPDIDLDFDSEHRDEVRDELMRRYSHLGCAVASTAQTFSLRGAVRAACRALGYSPSETDELAKNVPRRIRDRDRLVHYESEWEAALRSPAMKGSPLHDRRRYALLLELAERIEGRLSGPGTHLGGLVFGTKERHLSEIVPLEPSGKPSLVRCQYDKDDLELVGLPKLDVLGLKMHTALRKAGELVSKKLGKEVDPLSPTFATPNDTKTYELIRSGDTVGLFQLESPGQMALQKGLKPRRLEHIVSGISLFRPGPIQADLVTPYVARKNGEEPYSVPLPELDDILRPTYGVLVYQEQLMEMAARVSGCTLAEADSLRKAMKGRSDPAEMRRLEHRFIRRAIESGVAPAEAREVFGWLAGFGRYGFSAAHAASFAEIAYASAFMMAHHPAEALASLLNSQPCGFYSPRILVNEARRKGIAILPPDIHSSGEGFTVEDSEAGGEALRVGLCYCKGLSRKAISEILVAREKEPFASVADLYRRAAVERDALTNLIRGGFLDRMAPRGGRPALLEELKGLPRKKLSAKAGSQEEIPLSDREHADEHPTSWWPLREGRRDGELLRLPYSPEFSEQARVLGLDVVGHPLAAHRRALTKMGVSFSRELFEMPSGSRVLVAGLLETLQAPPTRSGALVHFLLTEDESGLLQSTIFEGCYRRCGHVLYETNAYLLEGKVEQDKRRGFSFVVSRIKDFAGTLAAHPAASAEGHADSGGEMRSGRRRRAG